MKFLSVVAVLLSLAHVTCGQEPSRATTVLPITERRIVGEEWNMLSECRTSLENYLCASQRTSVSVAVALNTGICAATVTYVNCLETTCTSTPALRESITKVRDRCQGFRAKSTTTVTQVTSSTTRASPTPTRSVPSTTRAAHTPTTDVPSTTRASPTPTRSVPSTTRAAPTSTRSVPSTIRAAPTSTRSVPSTTRASPTSTRSVPSTTRADRTPTTDVPSTIRASPTPTRSVPSTTRAAPTPTTDVPSTARASPTSTRGVPSTTRAAPTPIKNVISTTRTASTRSTVVPTSTTRRTSTKVYSKSLISETDLVDNEWSTLTTCRFLGADDVCNIAKKTLQSSLIIESGVCGSALTYVNCLETNCHSSSDLDASIQRVRNRCNGQPSGGEDTNTNAPQTTASTPPNTPRQTRPTTQQTSTQIPESDVVVDEWNTLVTCHLVDDEEEETCDNAKQQLQSALVSEYGICVSAIDYVECLEKVCMQTYALTNSFNRIRGRCNGYSSNGQGATNSPGTPVSQSDLVSNEWHALTTCSFLDEEEEEGCEDAKTELQEAIKYDSGICMAATSYIDCLENTCLHTHTLTDSISRIRTGCIGASQQGTQTPGGIVSDEDVVSKEWHTLSTCVLLDPEEEDCGEPKTDLQDALGTNSEVCEAASGYVECLEEACLITHTLTESLNRIKARCDGEGEDPEENSHSNLPGALGSESIAVNSELHTLTTCALLDPEEEDCGEPKTDLLDALRSNEDVCGAALEYVECLEEACLMTHALSDSFIRIKNRCGDTEEEDD